jgi:hypothetical protein
MSMTAVISDAESDEELKCSTIDLQKRPSSEGSKQLTVDDIHHSSNGTVQTNITDRTTTSNKQEEPNGSIPDRDLGNGSYVNEQAITSDYHVICVESPIPGMCQENNNKRKISDSSKISQTMITSRMSQQESMDEEAEDIDDVSCA